MAPDTGPDVHIAICGAGPVGAAAALFLRERGVPAARIALLDARPVESAAADDRMIAISHGSATLLARLGAWHDGVAPRATPIHTIHVSHRGRFGRAVIDRRDYRVPALGHVVRHGDLTQALDAALARNGVVVRRPWRVVHVEPAGRDLAVAMTDAAGASALLTARHVVHAEGGLFDRLQRRDIHRDYGQTAITAFVTTSDASLPLGLQPGQSLAHTAFERFTVDGPIALLPAVEARGDGPARAGYSLVWCGRPDDATARLALDDAAFLDALHTAFGDRLGRFASVGPRRAYPLGLNAVAVVARARSASAAEFAIGNAAQALHPVAGQGLNLGLRDAHDVAAVLGSATVGAGSGSSDSAARLVARYRSLRRADRAATVDLTDALPRVFASSLAPVGAARGLALAVLDIAAPLRGVFARQMMYGRR